MRDDQAIPNGVFDCLLQMMQSASPFTGFRLGTCLGLCTEYIILFLHNASALICLSAYVYGG